MYLAVDTSPTSLRQCVKGGQDSSKPLTATFACLAGESRVSNSDLDSTGKARNTEYNLQYLEDVLCGGTGLEVRLTHTDKQWRLIEPALPGRPGTPGRSGNNNRMSLEGMIWITRTGAPWRDLPKESGNWNTVHRRFRRWAQSGVFQRIFDVIGEDLDLKAVMVDGTFAKVHQHGAGAKKAAARLTSRLIDKLSAVVEAGLPQNSWPWLTRPDALSGLR